MLSRAPIVASIILKNTSLTHDSYIEQYTYDEDFKDVYEKLTRGMQVENFYLQDKLLYHLEKLCIPISKRVHVIREAHTSLCYWPRMKEIVSKYVKGCLMCSTCNPTNLKFGLSHLILGKVFPWIL